MYDLGIIGGMGPLATADIYRKIVEMTKVEKEQDHLNVVILNKANINDRTSAILKKGPSPVGQINKCIEELVSLGVKNFFIGCNTIHYFQDEFIIPKEINFINIVDEALLELKRIAANREIIILATKGTILANIYKTNKNAKGLNIIYPNEEEQTWVMDFIYKLKAGKNINELLITLNKAFKTLLQRYENPLFVLACTELSIVSKELEEKYDILDAADVLVTSTIKKCGRQVVE